MPSTPKKYKQMEFAGVMIELAKLFEPQLYVELGVRHGHTFLKMAPYVKRAVGVDIVPTLFAMPTNATCYEMPTLDFAKGQQDESIDFLFIDADHKCEAVMLDLDAFLPKVKTGTGLIFMHDTHPIIPELAVEGYCHDAWKAADNVFHLRLAQANIEIVTFPGPWAGLSILRKRGPHHLSWATKDFGRFTAGEDLEKNQAVVADEKGVCRGASESENNVPGEILPETNQSDVAHGNDLPGDLTPIPTQKTPGRRLRNR